MSEPKDQSMSRRKALKVLSAAAGATTLSLLPGWEKPVVGIGALPAFAQASLGTGDFQVTLTWNTGDPTCEGLSVDIDLHVIEPGGAHVYYLNKVGPTATLDVDNTCGLGPENIFVPTNNTANGIYQIYLVYYSSDASPATSTLCTVRVKARATIRTFTRTLTAESTSTGYNVCTVEFPVGTITEVSGIRSIVGGQKSPMRRR
jgi:uncharacterized protein YfaP (DUF2135 family)